MFACACLLFVAGVRGGYLADDVCAAVEVQAHTQGFDPSLFAGMAFHESRFEPGAVNERSGAMSILGVIPRFSPVPRDRIATVHGGVEAGLYAALNWRDHEPDKWLECYASGNRCRARTYAGMVRKYQRQFLRIKELLTVGQCGDAHGVPVGAVGRFVGVNVGADSCELEVRK